MTVVRRAERRKVHDLPAVIWFAGSQTSSCTEIKKAECHEPPLCPGHAPMIIATIRPVAIASPGAQAPPARRQGWHLLVVPAHDRCFPIDHNHAPIREKGLAPGVRRSSQALDGAAGVTPIVHHRRRLRPCDVIQHGPLFGRLLPDVDIFERWAEASAYHALDLLRLPT